MTGTPVRDAILDTEPQRPPVYCGTCSGSIFDAPQHCPNFMHLTIFGFHRAGIARSRLTAWLVEVRRAGPWDTTPPTAEPKREP